MDFDKAAERLARDQKKLRDRRRGPPVLSAQAKRQAALREKAQAQRAAERQRQQLESKALQQLWKRANAGVRSLSSTGSTASSSSNATAPPAVATSPVAGSLSLQPTSIHGQGDKIALPVSVLEFLTQDGASASPDNPWIFRIAVPNPQYSFPASSLWQPLVDATMAEHDNDTLMDTTLDDDAFQEKLQEAYLDELKHKYLAFTHGSVVEFTQEEGHVGLPAATAAALLGTNHNDTTMIPHYRTVDPAVAHSQNGDETTSMMDDYDQGEPTPGHLAYGAFDLPNTLIEVSMVALPKGKACTLQPTEVAIHNGFYNLKDVKLVLEQSLIRTRATLSLRDVVHTWHRGVKFDLVVTAVDPPEYQAVVCINTDITVDFSAPPENVGAPTAPTATTKTQSPPSGRTLGRTLGAATSAPPMASTTALPLKSQQLYSAKRNAQAPGVTLPAISIVLNRVDLHDLPQSQQQSGPPVTHDSHHVVEPFSFQPPSRTEPTSLGKGHVGVTRAPPSAVAPSFSHSKRLAVMDNSVPNPFGPSVDKYWKQRRRLFSRFDEGIQLDEEGWFSVTPEIIADHVAQRLVEMAGGTSQPIVVLDAFCGCGGNTIAFAKQNNMTVIACDLDRTKLRKAAHNAAIYQIPPEKIIFVECNALFLLEFCFRDGQYILDQPVNTPEYINALMAAMPPPVSTERVAGFAIGGIDLLARSIDAVFMDPPWGGVDYEVFGKHGYCLEKNMRIKCPGPPPAKPAGAPTDDFFDSFQPQSKSERKSNFNVGLEDSNCINGVALVRLAATATARRWVVYDIPRNTNRTSLGGAALAAGYRGNIKLDEHYLNGRLKTVTAYMGTDWRHLLEATDAPKATETATSPSGMELRPEPPQTQKENICTVQIRGNGASGRRRFDIAQATMGDLFAFGDTLLAQPNYRLVARFPARILERGATVEDSHKTLAEAGIQTGQEMLMVEFL